MAHEEITWQCDGHEFSLGLDRLGDGPTLLLLPAFSSISTRQEMQPLARLLSPHFSTVSVDWPGFGGLPKPFIDWRPDLYDAFLGDLLSRLVSNPYGIIAAGHAAGYLLRHFSAGASSVDRLVLLSPTWRGPLPTMMGGDRDFFPKIASAVDSRFGGPLLYRLNVNRLVVGMMARGHVYENADWLEGQRLNEKLLVTKVPGARHGSARFVAGRLDPFGNRAEFLKAARNLRRPTLNLFSRGAPGKSMAEMEALAGLDEIETIRLPRGKLSFYEEFPDDAAESIIGFLRGSGGSRDSQSDNRGGRG